MKLLVLALKTTTLAVLMGAKRDCIWIIMILAFLFNHVEASKNQSLDSLNSFLHNYSLQTIPKPRTGQLYNIPPPANFSGAGISLLRLRTHSLWNNGANLTSIQIPSTSLPFPFTKRVDLVYQNLGNWSTSYYEVPSYYTFIAPVIGLQAYDSDGGAAAVDLDLRGNNPITIHFDKFSLHRPDVGLMQCVKFAADGAVAEFSNVTGGSSCAAKSQGHFSIVVPTMRERKKKKLKWWMVGIPAAVGGVILIVVLAILGFKICRWRSMREMEKMSEKSEGLNTVWIGESRMFSASGIRTQPNLETSYIP